MRKKKWLAPKLVVLVRGTPDEVVLQECIKIRVGGVGSPGGAYGACDGDELPCLLCLESAGS
ncbi:MAG: hypothetical protein NC828_02700 [Candidatus Omnitrophica bacterium]|nr:hypothetical protein [Candidatus Omnitrophota bacterium]